MFTWRLQSSRWIQNPLNFVSTCYVPPHITNKARTLRDSFSMLDLNQYYPILDEEKGYTLDLVFANVLSISFNDPTEILSKLDKHHPPASLIPFFLSLTGPLFLMILCA